ncbi:tripartite tricarboxylate transporter substrate binding protein [Rhodoplanes sp. TEM]|uniref:Tripartite tricarboxylate transporter substrate binding protein n=1 Tax=Rhodoplanes tepidamans TaxID=200616 RepID=A0ABT5J6Z3_RHOTP|nr:MULTISPECIES: tripartite tricarboxylate transporter substrate binding protein [Rhodoplanes]MDC7785431.1 tripartite tricarboxylate transporter substrate binding protein [Rhodoplanes tepidamans]MDC7985788.1 tripartite tricarboxylate transporter substrate binding protein [Rhodoplanes sp. TEM]MDQ0353115.1 tripartite-type tricarboxylate transporter receptor subunit TctC [Rhodoplanes tepidamans]
MRRSFPDSGPSFRSGIAALGLAVLAGTAILGTAATGAAAADPFPSRTVTLIVGYAAGGTGDVVARLIAAKLAPRLGQTVVVENRPGGSGGIAAQAVARATPDGHTVLVGQSAEIAINPHLLKNVGYDPDTELMPVALGTDVALALAIPPKAPYATLDDLLKTARSKPNGLSFASAGAGTPGHFAGELLKSRTKTPLVHVPYKGAGPALNDLLGGHVDLYFSGFPAVMPHVKSGSLKVLGVSSKRRATGAPDVPTVAELTGIKEFDITLWQGFFVPRGTPREVVEKLNGEINAILSEPDVKKTLVDAGAEVNPMSVAEFTAFVKQQSDAYRALVKETGVAVD